MLEKLIELDEMIKNADVRSIRWLYDRTCGLDSFADDLNTIAGTEGVIRFFVNEPSILEELDTDHLNWSGDDHLY